MFFLHRFETQENQVQLEGGDQGPWQVQVKLQHQWVQDREGRRCGYGLREGGEITEGDHIQR